MSSVRSKRVVSKSVLFGAAAIASVAFVGQTNADIITTETQGPIQLANGSYSYTYDAVLSFNSALVASSNFGQFGSIYDVATTPAPIIATTGLLNTSAFVFTETPTNTAAYLTTPTDSSTLYNIRFTYTGGATVVGPAFNVGSPATQIGTAPVDLGTFTITSPYMTQVMKNFDGESIASFGSIAGTQQGNVGSVLVPAPVPEPMTLGTLAFAGSLLLGRRRRA